MARQSPRVVHAVLSLDVGGLERMVVSLVQSWHDRGQPVSVLCVERLGQLASQLTEKGIDVVSLAKPPGRDSSFIQQAESALTKLQPEIVHTHQIGAAWYVGQAAKRMRLPVIHTEHGNPFARSVGLWQQIKARLFYRQTARCLDRICCVSKEIALAVCKWHAVSKARVNVVPNGIKLTPLRADSRTQVRQSLSLPIRGPILGTVGRLNEVKRQDLMLRVLPRLIEVYPETQLLLVGDGPERSTLEQLASDLKISNHVHFLGYQEQPERFIEAMDVFLLTSRSEGFPVSLLEAWSACRPVICTAVGGIPDIISEGRTGLLVPNGDLSALHLAIDRVIGNTKLAKDLAWAGYCELEQKYSLERTLATYESHYQLLMKHQENT